MRLAVISEASSFRLPLCDFNDDILFSILDLIDNGLLKLWMCGSQPLNKRLECAPRLRAIFPFGQRRLPLDLLGKLTRLEQVDLGFPVDHFHGRFDGAQLPESWKSLIKLNIQSPSLVRQIDPDLAKHFPSLLELSMTSALRPEDTSKKWVLPPCLRSFTMCRDLQPDLPLLELHDWDWIALLPPSVEKIAFDSEVSFADLPDGQRISKWPPQLRHLRLGLVMLPPSYITRLDYLDLSDGSTTFLELPHTLETLICKLLQTPPPKALPRSLRIFRNQLDSIEVFHPLFPFEDFLSLPGSALEDFQVGPFVFNLALVPPSLLASGSLDRLTSIAIEITGKFTIHDLRRLPPGLLRLSIYGERIPSKTTFQLPQRLTKFQITVPSNFKCSPHPILPHSLRTFILRHCGELPPTFVFPPLLRKFVSSRPAFSETHSFSMLPPTLTKLEMHILPSFLEQENFNPRLLPPNLRTLAVLFPRGFKSRVDWVRWWAHLPQEMPLESLTFSFGPKISSINLSFPADIVASQILTQEQYDGLGLPCLNGGPPITEPLSPAQLASMGLPYLHRTLLHLSVNLIGFESLGLVAYVARNLPPKLGSLILGPYEMIKLFYDIPLPPLPGTLWHAQLDLWELAAQVDDLLGTIFVENPFSDSRGGYCLSSSRATKVVVSYCHLVSRR